MASSSSQSLEQVFKEFCAFGAGGKASEALKMDNSKFAKLTRDKKLLDKKLTSTDVDIVFNKCKQKTERKISFAEFKNAIKELASIKYPGDPSGVDKMEKLLTSGSGAKTNKATKPDSSSLVDRMTDTSKYTGTHKQRFDESGKGRGLEGRDSVAKGEGMVAGSASGLSSYVQGYKHEGSYGKK